jgi:hypothetical protein
MKSLWNEDSAQELQNRANQLLPSATPLWGKMNVAQMLVHLNESLRMAIGELNIANRGNFITNTVGKFLFLYALPFPKNLPTAKELLPAVKAEELEEARAAFLVTLQRAKANHEASVKGFHPFFGKMTVHEWGRLMYKHADYHFKQFGV